jgi:lysophospholipid acyltransferase (LPLAT)-like uncharacterized protein
MTYLVEGLLLRILLFTCRIKIDGLHHILDTAKAGPCVVACWHNRLILVTYIVRKWVSKLPLCAVVSASGDGQLLSSIIQRLPNMKLIRVSHNNRHHALKLMVHNLKEERRVLIVTPDGPQGPRYQAKPGTLVAASATDAQLVALSWSATRFWQLKSWDRMIIPKPFSTIHISVSAPFQANQQDSLGRRREQLEAALIQESDTACKALKLSPAQSPT